jgi:hypothetical protein
MVFLSNPVVVMDVKTNGHPTMAFPEILTAKLGKDVLVDFSDRQNFVAKRF